MLATLVGLSLLLALVGGTATLAGCLLARRLRARQACRHPQRAAIPSGPPPESGSARLGGWQPSGPYSPRPWGSATGTSGPASIGSQRLSSSPTARA
jgi:hypothetical protein